MSNVQPLEVFWVLLLGIGSAFSVYCLYDAMEDKKAFKEKKIDGNVLYVTQASIRTEASRVVQQLLLLSAGVIAMFIPNDPRPPFHPYFAAFILLTFLAHGALLVLNSYQGFKVRRYFTRVAGGKKGERVDG